ncbi:G-type lectin S-receptor-like serine/threonine-protein kinase At4g27290 [Lycium barbarum]|uniref:G-type lectin S-receptor-like serine/threonine-protein kinase At4g27290 n=1 Tax=Lycium barbarum TaxID=112863 RepID=UPI00293F1B81|nr:G-type lectin S-receptor-like serine/threonine-protein kinase At4g27290 [Lycium barbarum]
MRPCPKGYEVNTNFRNVFATFQKALHLCPVWVKSNQGIIMEASFFLLFLLAFCSSIPKIFSTTTTDLITTNQFITDGETIVSSGGTFELGFFSPSGSSNQYIGIWYKTILPYVQTVVWVANREKPLTNTSSAVLKVSKPGTLALFNDKNETIWSTNTSRSVQNPIAVLLDSGNLVVKDANDDNPENFLWQSFHFPTDTHLPDMKLGKNFKTGHEIYLSAWKTYNDPAQGEFTRNIDPTGYPQVLTKRGTTVSNRIGPWNGLRWSGAPIPLLTQSRIYTFQFIFNEEEVYYIFSLINYSSALSRIVLSSNGDIQRFMWVDQTKKWHIHYKLPADNCDTYSLCGVYGSCDISSEPICGCLEKFVAKHPQQWATGDWTGGCVRRTPLDCNKEHVFIKYSGIKLPDTKQSQYDKTMTLEECRQVCSRNCSCTAYSSLNISNGDKGCLFWFGELIDIRKLSERGQDIFIRMDSSEQESEGGSKRKKAKIIGVSFSLLMAMILLSLISLLYKRKKKKMKLREDGELPLFKFSTIIRATNNFSVNNKIGEGGFGPVYKGVLEEGQEIAVKRLSRTSMQGVDEYKNEVIYIAKLQHRNLVRLLGCCIQGEEKMLIYEYMPNKSLDSYIFDKTKSKLLDWPKRFDIINGIARGLLYLHQDSRLRIIHRDLKASNVLLDTDMNPKISDFGMARSVVGNEMGAKTCNVVGTHGYMSPEYAVDGIFSVKSDVFSFGVMVLEIVSCQRNRGFVHQDHNLNLLGHAWKLYKDDRSLELIDEQLVDSCDIFQVSRSIQVGLLCVQQHPDDRPSMFSVVHMLANESLLPKAKEPGFFTERNLFGEAKSGSQIRSSKNEFTITLLDPR